jgi:hypothetical protein
LQAYTQKQVEIHKNRRESAEQKTHFLEMCKGEEMENPAFTKQLGRDTTIGKAQGHQRTDQVKVVMRRAHLGVGAPPPPPPGPTF